jgi:hypothetical protein
MEACAENNIPLVVLDRPNPNGTIIDGHNRYGICQKNNIKFQTQEKQFKDRNEVIIWIIINQLGRRNLLPYDRVRLNLKKEWQLLFQYRNELE